MHVESAKGYPRLETFCGQDAKIAVKICFLLLIRAARSLDTNFIDRLQVHTDQLLPARIDTLAIYNY